MFVEDLTPYFADFGAAATLSGNAVLGIFDNGYASGQVGAFGMASTQPSYKLPTASVPGSPVGLAFVYNSVTYTIAAHEPDGTGISLLLLQTA